MNTDTLARGLGWFSIGLGLTELICTEALTETLGMRGKENLVRAYGLRELGAGIGILATGGRSPGWVWSRVAGDALDIATLATATHMDNPRRKNVGVALASVVGITLLDIVCAEQLSEGKAAQPVGVPVPATLVGAKSEEAGAPPTAHELMHSITINKPASELQAMWRDPQVQAQLKSHFAKADTQGSMEQGMQWTIHAPLGQTFRWTERIVEEQPGELTRFESAPGADLPNEGSLHFRPAPGDWGTEVTLQFKFQPPGGALGRLATHFTGVVPDTLANDVLRRFKALAETGEVPTLAGNVSARGKDDTV